MVEASLSVLPLAALAFPNIDPVVISLGPLQVHWYGIAYVIGILFGWWWATRLVSNPALWGEKGSPITADEIGDFLVWAVAGIIVGGRLGYVLFYDFESFLQNPLQIAAIWQGGMSFHGGLLGTVVAMVLFARAKGFNVFSLFDVIGACCAIGIFLGRLANFANAELYGKPASVPWAVKFPNTPSCAEDPTQAGLSVLDACARHPSQLYEGILEGPLMFLFLMILTHGLLKLRYPGFVAGAFIVWYACSRIFVEFFRLPDEHIGYLAGGWLTMGMVLSLPMIAIGVWSMIKAPSRPLK